MNLGPILINCVNSILRYVAVRSDLNYATALELIKPRSFPGIGEAVFILIDIQLICAAFTMTAGRLICLGKYPCSMLLYLRAARANTVRSLHTT